MVCCKIVTSPKKTALHFSHNGLNCNSSAAHSDVLFLDVGPGETLFPDPPLAGTVKIPQFAPMCCRVERPSNADSLQSHLQIGPIHESCAHRKVTTNCESRNIEILKMRKYLRFCVRLRNFEQIQSLLLRPFRFSPYLLLT